MVENLKGLEATANSSVEVWAPVWFTHNTLGRVIATRRARSDGGGLITTVCQ